MKKLNRKGFTLVELLAVIIILAIVVGISIPAVLTTTSKAKENAFNSAATAMATWMTEQFAISNSGITGKGVTLDPYFKSFCATGNKCSGKVDDANAGYTKVKKVLSEAGGFDLVTAAGLNPNNFDLTQSYVYINTANGKVCVTLKGKTTGDYNNKIACGGVCQKTTSTNNDYCLATNPGNQYR